MPGLDLTTGDQLIDECTAGVTPVQCLQAPIFRVGRGAIVRAWEVTGRYYLGATLQLSTLALLAATSGLRQP